MKDFSDCKRGFYNTGAAYYARRRPDGTLDSPGYPLDEIMVTMAGNGGGSGGEFSVHWSKLGGERVPRLMVYDDAWAALAAMPDLLACMAQVDNRNITPAQFIEILKTLGFNDLTKYEPD